MAKLNKIQPAPKKRTRASAKNAPVSLGVVVEDVISVDETVRKVKCPSHVGGFIVVKTETNKETGSIKLFFDNGVVTTLTAQEQKNLKFSLS
jgi:hypothetical protein